MRKHDVQSNPITRPTFPQSHACYNNYMEAMRRTGSCDHKRQVQQPGHPAQLRCWDFVLTRSDGTAVRLHPEWSTTKVPTFEVEGHVETQIPRNGLGMSDGRGTFKYYKGVGKARTLKFGRRRAYV